MFCGSETHCRAEQTVYPHSLFYSNLMDLLKDTDKNVVGWSGRLVVMQAAFVLKRLVAVKGPSDVMRGTASPTHTFHSK